MATTTSSEGTYDVGTAVKISVLITIGGVATDPTGTPIATVKDPAGTISTPSVSKDSVGNYHAIVDTTGGVAGQWWYRWAGVGAAQGAEEDYFTVELSRVTA
jgi:hypothetical protein